MKRVSLAVAVALLATAACSGSPSPSPAPTESAPAAPAITPAAPASTQTSASGAPAGECLTGSYRLDRFVGAGASQTYGTGAGGDVTLSFSERGYTLKGAGQDPIRLTLAGGTGDLLVNGAVRGGYTGSGAAYDFTVGDSDGTATVEVAGQRQSLRMAEVASVLAPDGKATVSCDPPKMILLLTAIRLELSRR